MQEKNKEDVTKKIENSKKNQLKINLRIPMKEKLIIFGYNQEWRPYTFLM